jgi:hypothetical protein
MLQNTCSVNRQAELTTRFKSAMSTDAGHTRARLQGRSKRHEKQSDFSSCEAVCMRNALFKRWYQPRMRDFDGTLVVREKNVCGSSGYS